MRDTKNDKFAEGSLKQRFGGGEVCFINATGKLFNWFHGFAIDFNHWISCLITHTCDGTRFLTDGTSNELDQVEDN